MSIRAAPAPLAALGLLTLGACLSRGGEGPVPCGGVVWDDLVCGSDTECTRCFGSNQVCNQNLHRCVIDRKDCTADRDCCPGQICSPAFQQCIDRATPCGCPVDAGSCGVDAGTCPVEGQRCQTVGEFPAVEGCAFDPCGADGGQCPGALTCFGGHCVGAAPCGGGCAQGQVCVVRTNTCWTPNVSNESCALICAFGEILVLTDGMNVLNRCSYAGIKCACRSRPAL